MGSHDVSCVVACPYYEAVQPAALKKMLLISQLRLPVDHAEDALRLAVLRALNVREADLVSFVVDQRAIDARRGSVEFSYSVRAEVKNEAAVLPKADSKRVRIAPDESYRELEGVSTTLPPNCPRVVVVGTGPSGLMAGLLLARHGWKPILLERGKAAGDRARDVTGFLATQVGV